MVSQTRLDCGFNGYQVPANARAPRSARKRRSFEKKCGDEKLCAFDLLATVAGNLLLEGDASPPASDSFHGDKDKCSFVQDSVKKECPDEDKSIKVETSHGGNHDQDALGEINSVITASDCSEVFNAQQLVNGKPQNEIEVSANSGCSESGDVNNTDLGLKSLTTDNGKPHVVVSLDSSTKPPVCRDHVPHCSRDDVNLVSRDDDENYSGYIHPLRTKKSFRPVPRIGDRRIRKILASKYWKGATKSGDGACNNADSKPSYYNKRNYYYKCTRAERNYPIKKRKFFNHMWEDGGISSKCFKADDYSSRPKLYKGTAVTPSLKDQSTAFISRDSHVKLRIKSFRVPELFIEIPETATVGSLKRTVLEAVNAILGGGLRVGLHFQEKKVRDDSQTLLQTGISRDIQSDSLGFCLEPTPSKTLKPLCPEVSPAALPCDMPQPLTTRFPPTPGISHESTCDALCDPHAANLSNLIESDHDSAPSPIDSSVERSTMDCRALVPVPSMNHEALMSVSPSPKSKRPEAAQRRIRRPFSVAEVEALVQAVEKLGTGRWRDVKLRAFENAKHRTYVDLKDKWKTLVHTAKIAPQQRRGEPVPQPLLDRVLAAHAYWSQHQAKQQLKQQQPPPETLLLL